jgi:hypothetical protein
MLVLTNCHDADGNRTSLAAKVGSTADFVNDYSYDDLNREPQVTQGASTVTGHDAVDSKLVNFTYNADGQFAWIDGFNDLIGSSADRLATSDYGYDADCDITSLTHASSTGSTTYAD